MRIHDDGVGSLHACECIAIFREDGANTGVRHIRVEPEVVLCAQRGDFVDWIDTGAGGRPEGRDDAERL